MSSVTPVSEWKKGNQPHPLELPSGKTILARPVGVEAFFKAKTIPNSLMEIVAKAVQTGKEDVEELDLAATMASLAEDPERLQDVFVMADNITMYCVVEPRIYPVPPPEEGRDETRLYVDEIDMDDKLFIMNFGMGGSRDLESFREATTVGVGSVPPSDSVQLPSKPTPSD
jgi:hypothetical protein